MPPKNKPPAKGLPIWERGNPQAQPGASQPQAPPPKNKSHPGTAGSSKNGGGKGKGSSPKKTSKSSYHLRNRQLSQASSSRGPGEKEVAVPSPESAGIDPDPTQMLAGWPTTIQGAAAQDAMSVMDIRRIAKEEVNQALPSFSFHDLKQSVILEVTPIIVRRVEDMLESKIRDEVQRMTVQTAAAVATQAASDIVSTFQEGAAAQIREEHEPPPLMSTVRRQRPVSQRQQPNNSDARRWVDLMQESSPSSAYQEPTGPVYPGLEEIRPLNELFTRALSYRTYRLADVNHAYDSNVAKTLSKTSKRLQHAMNVPKFNGEEAIAILAFLKNFKYACDETDVAEGAALPLMKYFMSGEAKATMLSYIGRGTGFADTQPGVDAINSYPEAVQWLLLTYAKETVLQKAYTEVTHLTQGPGEDENTYALRLRKAALQCGDAFKERHLISIFIDGLKPYSQHVVRDAVAENTRMTFQAIRAKAQSLGDAYRESQRDFLRLRSNFSAGKTSRRATSLSADTSNETEVQGEILAIAQEGSYPSSHSPPSSTPSTTHAGATTDGQSITQRGLIKVRPGEVVTTASAEGSNPGPRPGSWRRRPATAEERFSLSERANNYRCFVCRERGHMMIDCHLIPAGIRLNMKERQQRAPFSDAEIKILRTLVVGTEEQSPSVEFAEEIQQDDGLTNPRDSSTSEDTEDSRLETKN